MGCFYFLYLRNALIRSCCGSLIIQKSRNFIRRKIILSSPDGSRKRRTASISLAGFTSLGQRSTHAKQERHFQMDLSSSVLPHRRSVRKIQTDADGCPFRYKQDRMRNIYRISYIFWYPHRRWHGFHRMLQFSCLHLLFDAECFCKKLGKVGNRKTFFVPLLRRLYMQSGHAVISSSAPL